MKTPAIFLKIIVAVRRVLVCCGIVKNGKFSAKRGGGVAGPPPKSAPEFHLKSMET